MKADVLKTDGGTAPKSIDLPKNVFGIEPNEHAVYLDIKSILTNARQGNVLTKNRSLVRGGGKKPWKQKGRGVARAGTIRSPLWRGGGVIFGPKPVNHHSGVNKKVKSLARKSAFSQKAKDKQIRVIEDLQMEAPKTKDFYNILKNLNIETKKITLLMGEPKRNVYLSVRNLKNLRIKQASDASTYDLLDNEILMIEQSAVKQLKEAFQ